MIRTFVVENNLLRQVDDLGAAADRAVWVDLLNPTAEEERTVEDWLGVGVPTREEMEEIEISSRLYTESGANVMTATLPSQTDTDKPVMSPVSFVLSNHRLVTVRYHEPQAFKVLPQRAEKVPLGCTSGETILATLLEAIVDRLADVLERIGRDIARVSDGIFHPLANNASQPRPRLPADPAQDRPQGRRCISNIQDSLISLQRLTGFLGNAGSRNDKSTGVRTQVKTAVARRRSRSADHASFLSQKITFLLDATLGMINIEQNAIIKIFSVAAVVFLPPTLVASVYGMNFDSDAGAEMAPRISVRPDFDGDLGGSAVSLYFKRRGWL